MEPRFVKPDESSPYPPTNFLKIDFNINPPIYF